LRCADAFGDKDEKKTDGEQDEVAIAEARREAEERRKEKHRKMEEEREKMRQEIRDKVSCMDGSN
jgi:complexin-1/2